MLFVFVQFNNPLMPNKCHVIILKGSNEIFEKLEEQNPSQKYTQMLYIIGRQMFFSQRIYNERECLVVCFHIDWWKIISSDNNWTVNSYNGIPLTKILKQFKINFNPGRKRTKQILFLSFVLSPSGMLWHQLNIQRGSNRNSVFFCWLFIRSFSLMDNILQTNTFALHLWSNQQPIQWHT